MAPPSFGEKALKLKFVELIKETLDSDRDEPEERTTGGHLIKTEFEREIRVPEYVRP